MNPEPPFRNYDLHESAELVSFNAEYIMLRAAYQDPFSSLIRDSQHVLDVVWDARQKERRMTRLAELSMRHGVLRAHWDHFVTLDRADA